MPPYLLFSDCSVILSFPSSSLAAWSASRLNLAWAAATGGRGMGDYAEDDEEMNFKLSLTLKL